MTTLTEQEAQEASPLEQEAAIAIFALGATLEWEADASPWPSGRVWDMARLQTDRGEQCYIVSFNPKASPTTSVQLIHWKRNGRRDKKRQKASNANVHGDGLRWYDSVAEAKAACTIHAATGQFPPTAQPMLPVSVDQNRDRGQ